MPRHSSSNTFLDTIATRFDGIHSNFVLGNAQASGWPIVYCSDGFCELTGFSRANVMAKGSGCKFLYGPDTADAETDKIRTALDEKKELKTEIQFYRKNGTPFWCLLDIVPIKNEKGDVVLFLVSHKDITKEKEKKSGDGGPDSPSKKSNSDPSSDDDDDDTMDDDGMPVNYDYGRRRSRSVLYHINGQLNKQNKAKSKLQQLNRLASQMPEYKVQEVKKSRFIIVHYGIFKIGWDWLILLCTFYIAILVPFNAAFRKSGRFKDFMYVDAGVEVLFAVDIFLNFRTTFLNKSGQVVYDSRLIAINYIKGWFLLDLLAAIPFDLLYAFSVETATMVHLLKLARLLRLARLLQKLERYNQYSVLVLALLMCMFALLAHWLACIWYAIGKAELDDSEAPWTTGWLFELSERLDHVIVNRSHNIPDMMTSYITALYFTCSSLTSVGFGNVSANTNIEKIFSVCAMLVGAIMHAVVFGNVTTIIQRMYARRATFHSKTKDLKDFFRIHHIPKELKHKMRDYFQAMWSINNGIDFKEIMKEFPEDMRGEIGLHLHREILSLPIFKQAPTSCLKSVSLQTERFVCGPGEFIMHKGDAVNYLYYMCSGSMEVLKDEQVVAILGKGDIFGTDLDYEDPISISGCDVRSLAYCELLCIQVKGLVDALLLYPDFEETFNSELPNDLTYNVREGHEDHSDDESSTAAPVITLPSISEDEEEEDDDGNNNDDDVATQERSKPHQHREEDEDEGGDGKGNTPLSPLLTAYAREPLSTNDWLASRGRMPNGHIGTAISMRLASHQSKLKQWINRARKSAEGPAVPSLTPTTPSIPITPTQTSSHTPSRPKLGLSNPAHSSLALRRTASGGPRMTLHRRPRDKLKPCRTLPTLNSVASERSVEQVMVHTLQMELEGTRDTVIGLERRLDDLHDDLSSISRNVDSLLRIVSQSPCPSNIYLSSHSLQPSYNPSPSPNPNYPTPSFYFSQSTDGDTRDSISLQSNSSPAPDSYPGFGHHRNEHFLSPFQAPKGGSFPSPSPLASPRVNFSPSPMSNYFPSFPRQGGLNINLNNDRVPAVQTAPDLRTDKTASIGRLHSPSVSGIANKENSLHLPHSHQTATSPSAMTSSTTSQASTIKEKALGAPISPTIRRGRSPPRPSDLSPLQPRKDKTSRYLPDISNRKRKDLTIAVTATSSTLPISPLASDCSMVSSLVSDHSNSSPFTLDKTASAFQDDYYKLTQLEPCDAESGLCEKGRALRLSNLELSSPHSPSSLTTTDDDPSKLNSKQSKSDRLSVTSKSPSESPSPKTKRRSKGSHSPKQRHSTGSGKSPSPKAKRGKSSIPSPRPKSSSKTPSPKSPSKANLTSHSPTTKDLNGSPSPIHHRPQSLSPNSQNLRKSPKSASSCSPDDIEFIDSEPFPEQILCPTKIQSPSLSTIPVFSSTPVCKEEKRLRSASTSALSQAQVKSGTVKSGVSETLSQTDNVVAPLSRPESISDPDNENAGEV